MAASSFADLVKMTTATTGAGAITLGAAVSGFRGAAALTDGAQYSYAIEDSGERETGWGVYTASGASLTRNLDASTTGALLDLSGSARVAITVLSRDFTETGTWTPSVTFGGGSAGITYATQTGSYVKFANNLVIATFRVVLSSKGSSAGSAQISLPFAVNALDSTPGPLITNAVAWTGAGLAIAAINGTSSCSLYGFNNSTAGGGGAVSNAGFTDTSLVAATVIYYTG